MRSGGQAEWAGPGTATGSRLGPGRGPEAAAAGVTARHAIGRPSPATRPHVPQVAPWYAPGQSRGPVHAAQTSNLPTAASETAQSAARASRSSPSFSLPFCTAVPPFTTASGGPYMADFGA